jgi:hypothetical protein
MARKMPSRTTVMPEIKIDLFFGIFDEKLLSEIFYQHNEKYDMFYQNILRFCYGIFWLRK